MDALAAGLHDAAATPSAWDASGDKSENGRRNAVVSMSSHDKLFKKKNLMNRQKKAAAGGTSAGSTDEMFRKKTMKRLVDDADILN